MFSVEQDCKTKLFIGKLMKKVMKSKKRGKENERRTGRTKKNSTASKLDFV